MKFTLTPDQFRLLGHQVEGGDLRPDYSGRGMYGATCLGFVPNPDGEGGSSVAQVQLDLAAMLAKIEPDDCPDAVIDALRDKLDEIGAPSQDSMGRSVIYYWRRVQVEGHVREARF